MKAVFFDESLNIREYALPSLEKDEALVRVTVAGICNTDLEIVRGYKGHHGILGHEFVGVVTDHAGDLCAGQRVVGEINKGCGSCEYCLKGLARHCQRRITLGINQYYGAMAEFIAMPVANLYAVPDEISDEEAVFTEPLAAACEILEQIHLQPQDRVAVIGDGKLGLLIFQVLRLVGCRVVLIGKHTDRINLLHLAPGEFVPVDMAKDRLVPHSFEFVVESTGKTEGMPLSLHLVRPRGTIVLKSTFFGHLALDIAEVVVNEIHLLGSRCGPFPAALRLLQAKLVSVKPLIAAHYELNRAVEAFQHAMLPGMLKVLLWTHELPRG